MAYTPGEPIPPAGHPDRDSWREWKNNESKRKNKEKVQKYRSDVAESKATRMAEKVKSAIADGSYKPAVAPKAAPAPAPKVEKPKRKYVRQADKDAAERERSLAAIKTPEQQASANALVQRMVDTTPDRGASYTPSMTPKQRAAWRNKRFTKLQAKSGEKTNVVSMSGSVKPEAHDQVLYHAIQATHAVKAGLPIPAKSRAVLGPAGIQAVMREHYSVGDGGPAEAPKSSSKQESFDAGTEDHNV